MSDLAAEVRRRLAGLSIAPEREAEIVEELTQHLDDRVRDLCAGGLSQADARTAAIAELAEDDVLARAVASVERRVLPAPAIGASVVQGGWFAQMLFDLRFALRSLRKHPAFSLTVAVTLALGIGGSSAMFTLVDGILLRPLPYPHADRLVQVMQTYPEIGLDTWTLSQGAVALYRDRSHSFDGFGAVTPNTVSITGGDRPERVNVAVVTGQVFRLLGVNAARGRTIGEEDDTPQASRVAVLSDGFWRRRFGGDTGVIGKTLQIDGSSVVIVGVMPAGFEYPTPAAQLWLPLGLDPNRIAGWFLRGVARLKPGVSPAAARQETTDILWAAARERPIYGGRDTPPKQGLKLGTLVTPLKDAMTGATARPLLVLQGAMLLILLIACANVATLLLGRGAGRQREIALRHALGATPRRVTAQFLTESVVLSLTGAAVGIGLAWAAVATVGRLPLAGVPRLEHVAMDWMTLGVTVALSVVTGLLFGIAPALQSRKLALSGALGEGARGSSAHATARRQHNALVMAQFALSLVLLIGAGLLIRSFRKMEAVDPGFRPAGVIAFQLPLPAMKYDRTKATAFHSALLDSLKSMPGVTAAAVVGKLPFTGNMNSDGYIVEGHAPPPSVGSEGQVTQETVSPGYFTTIGIPLVRGRDFNGTDRDGSLPAVIVDETLARRFWPDGDAIGKRIETTGDRVWLTIVGVVGGVSDFNLTDARTPHMYTPEGQPGASIRFAVVRTSGEAGDLTPRVRRAVGALDADLPVPDPHTLSYYVGSSLDAKRMTNILVAAFAVLAVVLASVGIYSVMSLTVRRRSREFAIRLAIGAEPVQLVESVLGQGLLLAGGGAAAGVVGALAVTRYLTTMLYEVSPTDPVVFLLLPVGLLGVALVACWLPAWRAGKSDPLVALREE